MVFFITFIYTTLVVDNVHLKLSRYYYRSFYSDIDNISRTAEFGNFVITLMAILFDFLPPKTLNYSNHFT